MIPLRLQLKNFLSYGAELQTVDFEPYQLICLSGKNGHGKSALLDAITWAVWGQARKQSGNSKADQGLLRLGQKQMMVIYDFIFNDQTYRIRREFALTHGKPYACLEFGILNRENDSITPLTDKTIKSTQAKINQMLGLDYDAFTNSAFLRQGHANEFSKKSPKERKTILAQIIGLERFETLKKAAHETAREKQQKKAESDRLCERLDQELEKSDELKKQMAEVTQNLVQVTEQEKKLKTELVLLEQKKKELSQNKQSWALINQQLSQINQEYATYKEAFHTTITQWRTTHKQLLTIGNSDTLLKQKKEIAKEITDYQKRLQKSLAIKKELLELNEKQQKIQAEITTTHTQEVSTKKATIQVLQARQKTIAEKQAHITKEYESIYIENNLITKRIEEQQKAINSSITVLKIEQTEKQFEKKRAYYHKWVARANMLTTKIKDIKQKQCLSGDNDQPSCPLCEQNLSASRKRFLQAKFDNETRFLNHQLHRLVSTLKKLKTILLDEHAQLAHARITLKNNQLAQAAITELKKTHINSTKKQTEYPAQKAVLEKQAKETAQTIIQTVQELKKLSDTGSLIKANKEYLAIAAQVEQLTKKINDIALDETMYIKASKKLENIEKELITKETLTTQKHTQEQRKEIVFTAAKRIRELNHLQNKQNTELKKYSSLENDEKQINIQAQACEKQAQENGHCKAEMLQQKGRLEAQLAKLEQYSKEYAEHQKLIKQLLIEIDEYQLIATALGKDGIQALLIEDVIPEIEQEANDLLSKLTDNQAQIFIDSLKDLKKGGTKETLDIKISDAAGIRPYEMFSGGEAFRIDFALRIAISKLLARRAGTSLQTLIIDEGFGSQDEDGLANIMDAIYKIQDDFSKVIIVSHLPTMKNQFPVHFVVQKNAQGSVIQVMEQG